MSIRGGFHGRLHRGIREVLFCTHPLFRGIRNDPCFFFTVTLFDLVEMEMYVLRLLDKSISQFVLSTIATNIRRNYR